MYDTAEEVISVIKQEIDKIRENPGKTMYIPLSAIESYASSAEYYSEHWEWLENRLEEPGATLDVMMELCYDEFMNEWEADIITDEDIEEYLDEDDYDEETDLPYADAFENAKEMIVTHRYYDRFKATAPDIAVVYMIKCHGINVIDEKTFDKILEKLENYVITWDSKTSDITSVVDEILKDS